MQTENRWVYQSKRRSPTDRRRFLSSLSLAPLPLKVSPSGSTEGLPAPLPAVFRQLCRGPVLTTHVIAWFHHGHQTCAESKHQLLCQTDTTFMSRIITGDESWVSCYDPETKQHMPLAETAVSKPEAVTLGQEWKQKHFFFFSSLKCRTVTSVITTSALGQPAPLLQLCFLTQNYAKAK